MNLKLIIWKHVKQCLSKATLQKIKETSHHWNGSQSQIREFKTTFVARVGEDQPDSSNMVLRGARKSGGYYGHNEIIEPTEPENEPKSTKRLDERLILTRSVFIICSLEKIAIRYNRQNWHIFWRTISKRCFQSSSYQFPKLIKFQHENWRRNSKFMFEDIWKIYLENWKGPVWLSKNYDFCFKLIFSINNFSNRNRKLFLNSQKWRVMSTLSLIQMPLLKACSPTYASMKMVDMHFSECSILVLQCAIKHAKSG